MAVFRKVFIIVLLTFCFFTAEFILFDVFGQWFDPNLLMLLIIFINLKLGIRYGLFAAFLAGLLKDSFAIGIFGANILSFIFCAYATVLVKRYFYEVEGSFLRILLAFTMSLLCVLVNYLATSIFFGINFREAIIFVMLPEVIATTFLVAFVFDNLKKISLKLAI
ncbi:MAG TPA: rod shape-determining protein MreD [Candidatus Omnitrophota bacterium]|nr:rod shape-determining protein MreD [Candidatus Omnitrophota bacterium]HPD84016.1 rod shape-determining protein MreD [Candidatus Omnitrophota bacterium]HRZ02873.1 rod shape-determining protein MreD [Candidatus Omnitrophota bacterium]